MKKIPKIGELSFIVAKMKRYILSNALWLMIISLIFSIFYTSIFILGSIATGKPMLGFRTAETTVIVIIIIFGIILGYVKSSIERFEFDSSTYQFWLHIIPVGFAFLSLGGNAGWIIAGIILSFCVIPYANRSTLAYLIGRSPQHLVINALSPRKPTGYQLYLIGKEIAHKNLLNDTGWNLVSLKDEDKGLLTIPDEHITYASNMKEHFPMVKVYYAEDKWDALDRYVVYLFTSQDIDENINLGLWKLVLGYAGLGENENVTLMDREYIVTKLYVFDLIPFMQTLIESKLELFPNAELLRQFTENILTFDGKYNQLEALREKVGWYKIQNERLSQLVIDLKETYGGQVSDLKTLLGMHTKEIGLEDIKLTEMMEKKGVLSKIHLDRNTKYTLMVFCMFVFSIWLFRLLGVI